MMPTLLHAAHALLLATVCGGTALLGLSLDVFVLAMWLFGRASR